MIASLLTIFVRSRRDLLVVRQRARQIAGLLGFNENQRAAVGAAAFEMACGHDRRTPIRFRLRGDRFRVGRLEFSLPDPAGIPPADDIPWLVQVLDRMTPLNVFEEIRQQNREMLLVLREMRSRRAA